MYNRESVHKIQKVYENTNPQLFPFPYTAPIPTSP